MRYPSLALLLLSFAACPAIEEDRPDAAVAGADAGGTAPDVGAACPAPGAGTKHTGTDIAADTVWRAVDSPHVVTYTTRINKGATLTIEPCSQVLFEGTHGLNVEGKLVARGTPTQRITFGRGTAATAWTYLAGYGGSIDLASATLTGGGSASGANGFAALDVRADPALPRTPLLRVEDVVVEGSELHGVSLRGSAGFVAGSQGLVVRGAAKSAVRAAPHLVQDLPAGQYTGNSADEILVVAEGNMLEDTTWKDRGVPYRVGDENGNGKLLPIGSTAPPAVRAQLTLEAGVKVRVAATGRIQLSKAGVPSVTTGAIVAQGTSAKPIVFSSAQKTPAAGDWVGLVFDDVPDAADKLDHVRIEYAGGWSGASSFHCDLKGKGGYDEAETGALLIFGQPAASFLTNSTIADSAGYGVDLAYYGTTVDFMATNTFERLATCKQSTPRDAKGACPLGVTCP